MRVPTKAMQNKPRNSQQTYASVGRLGIISNNAASIFQKAVIDGITRVAAQHQFDVIVTSYSGPTKPQSPKLAQLIPELADVRGVVAVANAAPDSLLQAIHASGLPISLVSHQIAGSKIPVAMSNNSQGIAELVRHLVVRCQRRNLVFVRGLRDQSDARERELAFRQELHRHDLYVPESHFLQGDFVPDVAAASIRDLIAQGIPFDGILATDYMMGLAVLDELRRSKIAVPDQVSLVAFGDGAEAEIGGLTTAAASVNEIGACAARQVISQIGGLRISGVTTLGVRLVVRETCGCQVPDATSPDLSAVQPNLR